MRRFKRKMVRVHMVGTGPSVEGILIERPANGFYRLAKSSLLQAENVSHDMDGETWIPAEKVLMVQILGESA